MSETKQNNMKEIFIDKVTVNMGVGQAGEELEKGLKILELVTKKKKTSKNNCKSKIANMGY
jgi:large subunit ribosomal protein L5